MLKNMRIKTLLIVAFAVICLSAAVITITSFFGFQILQKDFNGLKDNTWPQTVLANQIYRNINEIARAIRNVALLEDTEAISKERKRIQKAEAAIDEIIEKINKKQLDAKEKQLMASMIEAKGKYVSIQAETLKMLDEGKPKKDVITFLIGKVRPVQAAYFKTVDEFLEYQNAQMEASSSLVSKTVRTTQLVIVSMAIFGTFVAVIIAFITIRIISHSLNKAVDITNRVGAGDFTTDIVVDSRNELGQLLDSLKSMVERLKNAISDIKLTSVRLTEDSKQLSASAMQISQAMEEQSSRSSQIATASEEMSQTTVDIAKSATDITDSATAASGVAKDGEGIVSRSVDEVQTIAIKVSESADLIKTLGERSKQIGNIISVIKDIADQTNLLALNAAIEAARAGEQGRGFAVVADEVRKLAERTSNATSEISGMIQSIQVEVEKAVLSTDYATKQVGVGVDLSTQAGSALLKIVDSVEGLHQMVQHISSATTEMSSVSDQVSNDISTIAQSSKGILSRAEQITMAASDLAGLSSKLHEIANQFKV
ncbi:MAG TPA: methyl-accepting chemotaxis protein [Dissulfurispiraceae bacterium]|nr:methyl-accepting chemotaxis protein [Dissulfurispiraceae bacterium]